MALRVLVKCTAFNASLPTVVSSRSRILERVRWCNVLNACCDGVTARAWLTDNGVGDIYVKFNRIGIILTESRVDLPDIIENCQEMFQTIKSLMFELICDLMLVFSKKARHGTRSSRPVCVICYFDTCVT